VINVILNFIRRCPTTVLVASVLCVFAATPFSDSVFTLVGILVPILAVWRLERMKKPVQRSTSESQEERPSETAAPAASPIGGVLTKVKTSAPVKAAKKRTRPASAPHIPTADEIIASWDTPAPQGPDYQ
jgi:hypothetical protein